MKQIAQYQDGRLEIQEVPVPVPFQHKWENRAEKNAGKKAWKKRRTGLEQQSGAGDEADGNP